MSVSSYSHDQSSGRRLTLPSPIQVGEITFRSPPSGIPGALGAIIGGAGRGPEGPLFGFYGLPCLEHRYERQNQNWGILLPPPTRSFIS